MSTWIGNKSLQKKSEEESTPVSLAPKESVKLEKSLLVLVLDISPGQKYISDDPKALFHCIDAFITFGNAHCMLSSENEVAVIAAHTVQSHFLYPVGDEYASKLATRQVDGQFEGFLEFEETVRKTLKVVMQTIGKSSVGHNQGKNSTSSCLASALGRALCYINRKQQELTEEYSMNARICVLSGSSDATSQYMAFMNVFYASVQLGVMIDCCIMGQYATLLSQGADITKGMYLRPPQGHVGLLQHLLWSFLPEKSMRTHLARPPPFPVDYRAACFCHRHLISIGFVCSMCLSSESFHRILVAFF